MMELDNTDSSLRPDALLVICVVPDLTTDGEPCYMASHPELPGCMSHGATPEEAINNLRQVTELYLKTIEEP